MTPTSGRDLLLAGRDGLDPLLTPAQLAARPAAARFEILDGLRGELYGLASVIADRSVQRAWRRRESFPPYGLAQSLFSHLRMVARDPGPFLTGSIDTFDRLGRAYLDTVVFHLEREMAALRASELSWLPERVDELLTLFKVDAGRSGVARMRDSFSFMYGGLHFGTSLCVQMAEVMARLLAGHDLTVAEKVEVMGRSIRALYQVASANLEDIPAVYQYLAGGTTAPWLLSDRFRVQPDGGKPRTVDLDLPPPGPVGPLRYTTLGCPARRSPSGGPGAIATLWRWCAELTAVTGLIGEE